MIWRYLQIVIWGASFLVFPGMLILGWMIWKQPRFWLWWAILLVCAVFVYARFVEPRMLKVQYLAYDFGKGVIENGKIENTSKIKVAVWSDLHLGVYKGKDYFDQVVQRTKEWKPDLVLIAGDLVYDPSREEFDDGLLSQLGTLGVPVYAVTGNHDVGFPGYIKAEEVRDQLKKYGVVPLDNKYEKLKIRGKKINLVGISDWMEKKYDLSVIDNLKEGENNLILTHNPDTSYSIMDQAPVSLLVAGHTHGGQVRIPVIYKWVIPTKHNFDSGWYQIGKMSVWVSSGLGEVGLPFRLGVPPEVGFLEIGVK